MVIVKKVASLSKELEEHCRLLIDINQNLKAPKKVVRSLLRKSELSHKLNALGLGLILLPEPTEIGDIVGFSLLAFIRLLDKLYGSLSIEDVVQKANDEINKLSFYKEQIFN